VGEDVREQDSPAALRQLRPRFGEDRARLVEATEHRQRPGPVAAEVVVPPCVRFVLVKPLEELRHGSRAQEANTSAIRNGCTR